jgi:hypothetical protein
MGSAQEAEQSHSLENSADFSGSARNPQSPFGSNHHVVHANQLADSGGVEIRKSIQIQHDASFTPVDERLDLTS